MYIVHVLGWARAVGVVTVCIVNLFSGDVASPKPHNYWQTWVIFRHLKMLVTSELVCMDIFFSLLLRF